MLRVYERNEQEFESNGLGILENAFDVEVTEGVNQDSKLEFSMPLTDEKSRLLLENRLIKCENQLYRITQPSQPNDGKLIGRYSCMHVYNYDVSKEFIEYFPHAIGTSAYEIIAKAFAGTRFHVLTENEVNMLGMEWVSQLTDIFETERLTPDDIVNKVIETIGYGEKYIDNWNIALVERIGQDCNVRLDTSKNLAAIKKTVNTMDLITRIYIYGKNMLPVTSLVGEAYIDSPNISEYGLLNGSVIFSEISDVDMLLARGRWLFDEKNPERMDIPYTSYEGDLIDLSKLAEYGNLEKISIGDTVKLFDSVLGIDTEQRVIKMTRYPYQPSATKITLGRIKKDLFYYFNKFNESTDRLDVIEQGGDTTFVNQITEITKYEVLVAETIVATTAIHDRAFVQTLLTNQVPYILLPNVTKQSNGSYKWNDGVPTYRAKGENNGNIQTFIKMMNMSQQFIERHLNTPSDLQKIPVGNVQQFAVDGMSYFFADLDDLGNGNFITTIPPESKYPNMSAENRDMFKVMVLGVASEYVKAEWKFEMKSDTYIPRLYFGTGDESGNGKGIFYKDFDGFYLTYTLRQDTGVLKSGDEVGLRLTDSGIPEQRDPEDGTWKPIGTGSNGGNGGTGGDGESGDDGGANIIHIDHLPTQDEIDSFADDSTILVYDQSSPFVPVS